MLWKNACISNRSSEEKQRRVNGGLLSKLLTRIHVSCCTVNNSTARFKDKDHHTLKSSYYHRFEECLWKISVWRAMLPDPFILPFYPNKKQDTLPLGVDMHTREVRTSGRGKGYVGIGPLYMIGKVIDCLFSNSFLPQMFENTFWLRDK